MKKIAVPSEGNYIAQHFGHCPEFNIIESEGDRVIEKETIPNPGHRPNFLPKFLNDKGVDCVLAAGMGSRAINLFENNGIEVVTGATGTVDEAIKLYLEDSLETEGNICDH
ncbi:MAG: NifB/NifX family molybdenum-iron cluster-binding protein [Halanaerobiaceae bacterium]